MSLSTLQFWLSMHRSLHELWTGMNSTDVDTTMTSQPAVNSLHPDIPTIDSIDSDTTRQ